MAKISTDDDFGREKPSYRGDVSRQKEGKCRGEGLDGTIGLFFWPLGLVT